MAARRDPPADRISDDFTSARASAACLNAVVPSSAQNGHGASDVGDVDAPPRSHAAAWEAHVVPRLHGFADAVRRYRNDGARRAAFLCAPPERRAAMLREDFPFLATS